MIKPRLKSLLLTLLKEANIVVTVITAISILYLRSIHSVWFGLGTLVATATAKLLKKCIKQPRPTESTKKTYGMPSTHSSSITFFGIYLFLSCLLLPTHERISRLLPGGRDVSETITHEVDYSKLNKVSFAAIWTNGEPAMIRDPSSFWNLFWRLMCGSIFILMAMTVCWSRVKLGHHTPKQVITGAMVGGIIGWLWFGIWSGFTVPKVFMFNNFYSQHNSNFKSIRFQGIGVYVEESFRRISLTFVEAWYMRDFGLIWDSLIRPAINQIGFFFGFHHQIVDISLAPSSHLPFSDLHDK